MRAPSYKRGTRKRLLAAICAAALLAACGSTVRNPAVQAYVTRGIMAYMESEADRASVTGHVTARHGAQRATREQDAGLGVLAAAGYIASYDREQELQADGLGAEYLARAQFNPSNRVNVSRVLKSQQQCVVPGGRFRGVGLALPAGSSGAAPAPDQWGLWRQQAAPVPIG